MSISPISSHQYQAQLLAMSAHQSGSVAATDTAAAAAEDGNLDLFHAEKLYRQKSSELAKLSQTTGSYERETLSDSEIKSLRAAGVPIDAFVNQHGQKLGSREFGALAELIMKTIDQQNSAAAASNAAPTSEATVATTAAARAYV